MILKNNSRVSKGIHNATQFTFWQNRKSFLASVPNNKRYIYSAKNKIDDK